MSNGSTVLIVLFVVIVSLLFLAAGAALLSLLNSLSPTAPVGMSLLTFESPVLIRYLGPPSGGCTVYLPLIAQ